jgi:uncharacterized protein YdiU (UPF0061 family)
MLPLFDADADRALERARVVLDRYPALFEQHWIEGMRAKLGLFTRESEDVTLINDLLAWMQRRSADFTSTFRSLTAGRLVGPSPGADADLASWSGRWQARRTRQPQSAIEADRLMRRHNPAFIPRNHKVEEALAAASQGNVSGMVQLLAVLAAPYDHDRDLPEFSEPGPSQGSYRTYCGT